MAKINKYELIKLLKMSQNQVKQYSKKVLKNNGYKPILRDGFIYAEGNLPVVMIAHMDTVYRSPSWVVDDKGVFRGNNGLGADDRAGVYGILHLVQQGYRPHILFLEDEEIGCVGATKFCKSDIELCVKYAIELDRQGKDDCVYYDGINYEFENFVKSFGFKKSYGSFSDIAEICPSRNIAGVNLSVGYYHQHTKHEMLVLHELEKTIDRVACMLDTENVPTFDYFTKEYYAEEKRWKDYFKSKNSKKSKKSNSKYEDAYASYYETAFDYEVGRDELCEDAYWESENYFNDNWNIDAKTEYYNNMWEAWEDEKRTRQLAWELDDYAETYHDNKKLGLSKTQTYVCATDCYLNLPDNSIIDLDFNSDYFIGQDDCIYHVRDGLMKGAVLLNFEFQQIFFYDMWKIKVGEEYDEFI